jgi:hypothetical protein
MAWKCSVAVPSDRTKLRPVMMKRGAYKLQVCDRHIDIILRMFHEAVALSSLIAATDCCAVPCEHSQRFLRFTCHAGSSQIAHLSP